MSEKLSEGLQPEDSAAREWLCGAEELRELAAGRALIVAEERVAERLAECALILRPLTIGDTLLPVLRCLRKGGSDVATIDANYVRGENDMYRSRIPSHDRHREPGPLAGSAGKSKGPE